MSAAIKMLAAHRKLNREFAASREELVAKAKGADGQTPAHEWSGTKLRFQNPDGTWGEWVELKGEPGKPGKSGQVVVAGGGTRFNPSALEPLPSDPMVSDYLVMERNGNPYRVSLLQLNTLLGAEEMATYSKRVDSVSETLMYRGEAAPGSADAAPVWRIARIELSPEGDVVEKWAEGAATFIHAWTDRLTLEYL